MSFEKWTRECKGQNPQCSFTLNRNASVYAFFTISESTLETSFRFIYDGQTKTQNVIRSGNDLNVDVIVKDPFSLDFKNSLLEIFDLGGRRLSYVNLQQPKSGLHEPYVGFRWNTSGFAPGVYLAKITLCAPNCSSKVKKFIISPYPGEVSAPVSLKLKRGDSSKLEFIAEIDEVNDETLVECLLSYSDRIILGDVKKIKINPKPDPRKINVSVPTAGIYIVNYECVNNAGLKLSSGPELHFILIDKARLLYKKDNFFDLLFIPVGWSNSSEDLVKLSFIYGRIKESIVNKTPLRELGAAANERVRIYATSPTFCLENPLLLTRDGLNAVYQCAIRSEYKDKFDAVLGIFHRPISLIGGISIITDPQPYDFTTGTPVSLIVVNKDDSNSLSKAQDSAIHELGHGFGLYHIQGLLPVNPWGFLTCGEGGTCIGPNRLDCNEAILERYKFIMDYCKPYEKFGPAAYEHLRYFFRDYLY